MRNGQANVNFTGKCLHLSGIITEPLNAYHDANLISQGIGFTNMVGRTTKSSAALSRLVPDFVP